MTGNMRPPGDDKTVYQKIIALRKKHNLGFLHNPGGGEFTAPGFRCQITFMGDEDDDYQTLLAALREAGMEA